MQRSDPFRSFRFRVEIDGLHQAGFQAVSGLERLCQIEPYREGGINDFEHQLVTLTTYPPLVLKRGLVGTDLWDWHKEVIAGNIERRTISVVLLNEENGEGWHWVVVGAFPVKWTGAELDAGSNGIATESVEFAHQGLTRQ